MERGRFSLLLLDPGEIYFEDFSAVLITYDTTIKTMESKKTDGRLKLCSKSLVFDPKETSKPLIKIPLKDCDIIEMWHGSRNFIKGRNALRIECKHYTEMLEGNVIAPYVFKENGRFIMSLNFTNVEICLSQTWQLKRAMTLNAFEQADMVAAIVYSKHAKIRFDPLWMEYFESADLELQANKVTPMVVNPGRIVLSEYKLYFQPYNNVEMNPVIKISLSSIKRIVKRRFLLRHIGIEIYYTSSDDTAKESYIYLSLLNEQERDQFHDRLLSQKNLKLNCPDQDMMTLQWQNGVISNYDYLVYINSLGDRTKNDLTQYPIFPWVILDYTSSAIDLNDERIYRDLSKPMGALNEERWEKLKERYDEMPEPKFMYGSHYSTPGYVLFYLVRLYPEYMLCLQNGRFDHPDRMFNSMQHLCKNSLGNMSDFKELIPEFYDIEEGGSFLVNGYGIDFGYRHNDVKVGDVELPPWASTPDELIRILREALESDYVSRNLHSWIDLIFGYKQRGEEAVKAKNLFYHLCYEGNVDLNAIENFNERHTLEVQIMEFGQIPKQVFKVPHPKKRNNQELIVEPTIKTPIESRLSNGWKTAADVKLTASFSTHKARVNSLYIGEDNDKIVSVAHDSKAKIFSLSLNRQVRSAPIGTMPLSSCLKLPESNVLVIGNLGNEIALYDLDYGAITKTVTAHEDAVTCLKWSAKLNVLFSGSGDCNVAMWKGFKGKPIEYLLCHFDHTSQVNCISLDSSEEHLAVGTEDGEIYIWNLSDCTLNRKYYGHKSAVKGIDYSPDGQILVSCSLDGTFHVLDVNTGMVLYQKAIDCPLTCLKFDTCLYIGSQSGILHIWDMVEVKSLHEIKAHDAAILCLEISPDKKHLVTGSEDHLVRVWQPA